MLPDGSAWSMMNRCRELWVSVYKVIADIQYKRLDFVLCRSFAVMLSDFLPFMWLHSHHYCIVSLKFMLISQ